MSPQETTYAIQPGDSGGSEWPPSAFSPRTNFIYHHARYAPATYYTTPTNTSGGTYSGWGSITNDVPGVEYGLYGAIDSTTGKIVWKIQVSQALSGMTVGGDLVFFGDNSGLFYGVNPLAEKSCGRSMASPLKEVVPDRRARRLHRERTRVRGHGLRWTTRFECAAGRYHGCVRLAAGRIEGSEGRACGTSFFLCAEHVRQLGGESPLHNGMDVK